jgi:hypothetical protein
VRLVLCSERRWRRCFWRCRDVLALLIPLVYPLLLFARCVVVDVRCFVTADNRLIDTCQLLEHLLLRLNWEIRHLEPACLVGSMQVASNLCVVDAAPML